MKYAFLGLGELGSQLAANLVKGGHQVIGYDLKQEACSALEQVGGKSASSIKEAAIGVDAVITCLASPTITRKVWDELLEAQEKNPTDYTALKGWIEMGTNEVLEIEGLAERLKTVGIATLAAPVSGGVHRAASAKIVVLAGGDKALYDTHHSALSLLGREVFFLGGIEQAATLKVVTNMLAFIHLIASGEAMMLAKKAGIDLATAFHAIKASSGTSFVHETEMQVILNGSYDIAFTLDLAVKDAQFAMIMAERYGVPLELAPLMTKLMEEAKNSYGGNAWSPKVVALLEETMQEPLRANGFPSRLDPE